MNFAIGILNNKKCLGCISIFAFVILGIITYILLGTDRSFLDSKLIFVLLYVDIFLILLICVFVIWHTRRFFVFRKKKEKGNRFHKQIIVLFSGVTILPALCVFVFSILFLNVGIENLFKNPVKNVIDHAGQVASIYINDMKFNMQNFVNGVAEQIKNCIDGVSINEAKMNKILDEETATLKVDMVVMQAIDKNTFTTIASTPFSMSLQFEELPKEASYIMNGGVIAWESGDFVLSAAMIDKNLGIYLLASTAIDKTILDHKHKIKTAITEYTDLATKRAGLKFSFIAFFSIITALLLLLSILVGILFANWILRPVNKLIIATKNITSGDYSTTVKVGKFKNEWDVLISTFNDMMSKLEQQKQQLIISNRQNAWRDIARKIAHEIKNPLTPIQLSAERLRSKYGKEIETQPEIFNSCIDTIIRQVTCIGNLVNEFSDFARMPSPKFETTDIVKLLKGAVFLLSSANKNILFHQNYEMEELFCETDQAQMNQVIMNILQNSVNAVIENNIIKSDGTIGNIMLSFCLNDGARLLSEQSVSLDFKGRKQRRPEVYMDTHEDLSRGSDVRDIGKTKFRRKYTMQITVEDDGPGFSDTSIEKALDPYYTTREAGSGLGLSIVHKIVTDHSGEIILGRSNVLKGAKISIFIPLVRKEDPHGN